MQKKQFLVKFAVVAMFVGLLSPSIDITTEQVKNLSYNNSTNEATPIGFSFSLLNRAEARRGGGGGARRGGGGNRNRSANRNRNTNRNVNRNVNVNHNVRGGRYYGGGYYRGAPLLAGAVAGLAIGTIVASVPTSCTTVINNGVSYRNCSGTYYEPYYQGSDVQYRVVNSPY